jgi:hypothetical protein
MKKAKKDLVIDFETMAKDANSCAVIDCSVIAFDWDRFLTNPYTLKDISLTKRFKLSVKDQVVNYDWSVEKQTIAFWEEQSAEVRSKIVPKKDDLTVKEFTSEFISYLIDQGKIEYWWSRSNTFDPIILSRLFKSQNKLLAMEEYLKFWRVRDTRTYIDAKFDFKTKNGFIPISNETAWEQNFKEHDSSWDILADVLRLQAIVRAENDLEMIAQ